MLEDGKMIKNFKVEDFKTDYLVEIKDNRDGDVVIAKVCTNRDNALCISSEKLWFDVASLDSKLISSKRQIIKVFGRTYNNTAYDLNTDDRELLWEYREVKKYTLHDLEGIVGHEFEIVKEELKPEDTCSFKLGSKIEMDWLYLGKTITVVAREDGEYFLKGEYNTTAFKGYGCTSLIQLERIINAYENATWKVVI